MKCQSKIRTAKLSISWVGILLDARPKHLSLDSHVVFSFLFCLILADLIPMVLILVALILEDLILADLISVALILEDPIQAGPILMDLILANLILANHMALVLEEAILVLKESQPLVGLILVGLIRRTQSWQIVWLWS